MLGRLEGAQPLGGIGDGDVEHPGHRRRRTGIEDGVLTGNAQSHRCASRGSLQGEADTVHAVGLDVDGPDGGTAVVKTKPDQRRAAAPGDAHHLGIVGVETGGAVSGERVEELRLGVGDGGDRPQQTDVGVADVEQHPDAGLDEAAEVGDLPRRRHRQLDHEALHRGVEAQHGEGNARPGVEVSRGAGDGTVCHRQRAEVLGGGLADAAGDADHLATELLQAAAAGQAQRRGGVGDAQQQGRRGSVRRLPAASHHRHRGPASSRVGDKGVTVGGGAADGDEGASRDDVARVGGDTRQWHDGRRPSLERAPEEAGKVGGGQAHHRYGSQGGHGTIFQWSTISCAICFHTGAAR